MLKEYRRPTLRDKQEALTNEDLKEEIKKVEKVVLKKKRENGK